MSNDIQTIMFDAAVPPAGTFGRHAVDQAGRLAEVVGVTRRRAEYARLLGEMLGPAAALPVRTPRCSSELADDHTPFEYSLSLAAGRPPQLRFLVEPNGWQPGPQSNKATGENMLRELARRFGFSLADFDRIKDLFLPENPQGPFAVWLSAVFDGAAPPLFKTYLNPAAQGVWRAPEVVQTALARLGFAPAYRRLARNAAARGFQADRLIFFSLDLGTWSRPRVKLYVAHEGACAADAAHAAAATPDVPVREVAEFCRIAGGPGPFRSRPLISCYALTEADRTRPSRYTLHVPIRCYVTDDAQARDRVAEVLRRNECDTSIIDRSVSALTDRRLDSGVGLIAYVSQEFAPDPGRTTVYLSAEAKAVTPARSPSATEGVSCR